MSLTVLITSFVMALAGLVASPIATASENDGSISATFASGSSVLTKAQKAAIKKALATSGTDVTYTVTGTAGKLPGVSNRSVKALAKARANAIKAYLVSLGVSKSSVTTQTSTTEIGVVPRSTGSKPTQAVTDSSGTGSTSTGTDSGSGSGSGSGSTPTVTYVVGDTGPGGGIVYYVHTGNFACGPTLAATCKYLEVAPSTWFVSDGGSFPFAITGNEAADIVGLTDLGVSFINTGNVADAIGIGYKNSDLIITQNGAYNAISNIYAAGAARAYTGGSMTDWYLPAMAELNLLCQWNRGRVQNVLTACSSGALNTGSGTASNIAAVTASAMTSGTYITSSELNNSFAWQQSFNNGMQNSTGSNQKLVPYKVRPIRAF